MGALNRLIWSPWVLHFYWQVSFGKSELNNNPATHRMLMPVTNFLDLTRCCKRNTPSSLSGTWMTLPAMREVCHSVFVLDLCSSASSLLSALEFDHRFPTICGVRAAFPYSPLGSILLCPLLPSLFPNSTLLRRPHQALENVLSLGLG